MNAAEHFDQAVDNALNALDRGGKYAAMRELMRGLAAHQGTRPIMTSKRQGDLMLAVMEPGLEATRRFIEDLPRPGDGGG